MRPKRLILLFDPFACILLYALFVRTIDPQLPRATAEGAHLKIAALADGEEVIAQKVFSHRDVVAREYRIVGGGDSKEVTVFSLSATWQDGRLSLRPEKVLAMRPLSRTEAEGLDALVAVFRSSREEYGSGELTYRLSYFREGRKIGEEFFVGYFLSSRLTYFSQAGYKGDSMYDADYTKLAEQYGLTLEQVQRMVTFEMLEAEPNKAPEPTSGSVTPRAIE